MKVHVIAGGLTLAGLAATPALGSDLAGVRLGVHEGSMTRVVLDLKGGGAGFSYSLSDDGTTLIVALRAKGSSAKLPRGKVGLVKTVSASPVTNGTRISVAAGGPISVVQNGVLEPERGNRFYRIYFDLGPASGPPPAPVLASVTTPAPIGESQPVAMATATAAVETAPEPVASPEEAHMAHEAHEAPEPREEAEEHHPEPVVTVKVGGVFERSVSDYTNTEGATAALQTGLFHDALEMELGTTALRQDGHTNWKTGLIFKKPVELTENVEFAVGAGPIWLHRPHLEEDAEAAKDSAGVEGVLELVYWPGEHHSLGFYAETGYSYDFGKGHEKAAGAGGGLLIPLP